MKHYLLLASLTFTGTALAQHPEPEEKTMAVYGIGDLTGATHLAPVTRPDDGELDPARALVFMEELEAYELARERASQHAALLHKAMSKHMTPALSKPDEELLRVDSSSILLLGTSAQHQWAKQFLELQREDQGMLDVAMKLYTVPAGAMETLGVVGSAELLTGAESRFLEQRLAATDGVERVSAPRILTLPRQEAHLSVLNQIAYVRDYELVVVEPGGIELADPVVDVIEEGVNVILQAVAIEKRAEGFVYAVEVDFHSSSVERPIPTVTREIGAGRHPVEIGLPVRTEVGLSSSLLLGSGAVAVLVTPDPSREVDVAVVIEVHRVTLDEEAPGAGK